MVKGCLFINVDKRDSVKFKRPGKNHTVGFHQLKNNPYLCAVIHDKVGLVAQLDRATAF